MTSLVQVLGVTPDDAVNSKPASRRTDRPLLSINTPPLPPDWGKTSHPPAGDES